MTDDPFQVFDLFPVHVPQLLHVGRREREAFCRRDATDRRATARGGVLRRSIAFRRRSAHLVRPSTLGPSDDRGVCTCVRQRREIGRPVRGLSWWCDTEPERRSSKSGAIRIPYRKVRARALSDPQIQLPRRISSLLSTCLPTAARTFLCACLLHRKSPKRGHQRHRESSRFRSRHQRSRSQVRGLSKARGYSKVVRDGLHTFVADKLPEESFFVTKRDKKCLGPCCFTVRLLWREGGPHRKGTRHVGR